MKFYTNGVLCTQSFGSMFKSSNWLHALITLLIYDDPL